MKLLRLMPLLPIVAGCSNPAPGYTPVPPAEIPTVSLESVKSVRDLMPLDVGNHWTYALQFQSYDKADKPLPLVRKLAEIEIAARWPDGTAVVVFRIGGEVVDRQAWHAESTGLFQVEGSIRGIPVRPAMPLLPFPVEKGKRFTWSGRGPSPDDVVVKGKEDGEILPSQNVDLTNGTVSAVPVSTRSTFGDSQTDATTWFQPGVGIVRLQQETKSKGGHTVLTFTLSEHTMDSR